MLIIPYDRTEVRKRQRTKIEPGPLHELKERIVASGLLHPPVFWHDAETDKWVLTVGERRYRAIKQIHIENRPLYCHNQLIPRDCIPITQLSDFLDEIGRFEAELNENVARADLEWPDRVRAFADLHAMRQKQDPKHTLLQTATEVVANRTTTRTSPKAAEAEISRAVIIAAHLDNEKIANARNPAEAEALIYKQEEEKLLAAIISRNLAAIPENPEIKLRHGDLLSILPNLDAGQFDLILGDPPYGIGASGSGFRARTVHHHNYEDTPEDAKRIAQCILTEGFRITKPRANLFLFCDIKLFDWLCLSAGNMGWAPFQRPLIWVKSESEGLAPWGGSGPRITTEFIFFATKGQRGLHVSPTDVFNVKRVPRQERLHAAEKPVELLTKLIACSTLPGDMILDPCCGSGSSLVAAKEGKRRALGIEKDTDYYNTAMANVFGGDHGKGTL